MTRADDCPGLETCEHCAELRAKLQPALPAPGTVERAVLDHYVMKQHQPRKARIDDDGR